MVRINLIKPEYLADQHLIAEYNEILMLLGYFRKYPGLGAPIPKYYLLGPGHMKFFKNKLIYVKNRHEELKEEMRKRRFVPTKTIDLHDFADELKHDFTPRKEDIKLIKKRLTEKIKLKPEWYKYYGKHKSQSFFLSLIKKG